MNRQLLHRARHCTVWSSPATPATSSTARYCCSEQRREFLSPRARLRLSALIFGPVGPAGRARPHHFASSFLPSARGHRLFFPAFIAVRHQHGGTSAPGSAHQRRHHQCAAAPLTTLLGSVRGVPHPDKQNGGEDAAYLGKTSLGVADGVGGWKRVGVDPGHYARALVDGVRAGLRPCGVKNVCSSRGGCCRALAMPSG